MVSLVRNMETTVFIRVIAEALVLWEGRVEHGWHRSVDISEGKGIRRRFAEHLCGQVTEDLHRLSRSDVDAALEQFLHENDNVAHWHKRLIDLPAIGIE
jgi:hypothetical protein